jgi:predicted Zn-ribbon and HTH transcriptional regulator
MYISEVEEDEDKGVELRCRHCDYEWEYTGGAKQTRCPNCDGYVNTKTDRI